MELRIRQLKNTEYSEALKLIYKIFPDESISISNSDRIMVASLQDTIIGFVHYGYRNNKGFIKGFGVEDSFRGLGIGKKIMSKVLKIFDLRGIPVYLKTKMDNPALSMYLKLGFVHYKFDEVSKTVYLVRKCNT